MSDSIPSSLSILIADDNEMNRWLLNEQLQTWSPRITECLDGGQAWQAIQKEQFDLLLLDVNMPVCSGLELIQRCRSQANPNQSAPAIAITAHAQTGLHAELLSAGFTDCLIKPIKLMQLQQAVSRCLVIASDVDIACYAQAILQKTEFNPRLSATLLEKLFAEIPVQLQQINDCLPDNPKQAWEVAHRLHGSFCFYGFEEIRPLIATLEQYLLDQQLDPAQQQLQQLQARCENLLNHREILLDLVLNAAS